MESQSVSRVSHHFRSGVSSYQGLASTQWHTSACIAHASSNTGRSSSVPVGTGTTGGRAESTIQATYPATVFTMTFIRTSDELAPGWPIAADANLCF